MGIIPQLILNSVIAGAIYTMIALGFTLVFRVTKFFNLAHGSLAVVGGYAAYYFSQMLGWNLFLASALGIIFAGFSGYLINKFVYQPLRLRKASTLILLIASLGVFTLIQALVAIFFSSEFQNLSQNINNQNIYHIGNGVITQIQIWILILGIFIAVALVFILAKTKFGKSVVAIGDDEEVSKIIGINTNVIISQVFIIGSAIAGLSGILVGLDTGLQPTMGLSLLLKGVIAAVIGGLGDIYGAVLGAFLLGFVENFGIWKISGEWKDAIAFGLLIIFMIFRPQGIISK
jgi:branched-chain amino acid transport system permease protein